MNKKLENIPEIGIAEVGEYIPTPEEEKMFQEMELQVEKEIKEWGGRREGAGRKPTNGVVLQFQVRVSAKEKEFLQYARKHHLNYDDLMQG